MSEAENLALLNRYYEELVNQGNLDVVDEIIAEDYVSHHNDPANLPHGPEGVKAFISITRTGFPDLRITVSQIFAEGDQVASMWTMEGTQTGEWFGAPPSGKRAKWDGIVVSRIANGKIAEDWYNFDQISLLMQLGIIPSS